MRALFLSLIRAIHRNCGRFRPAVHHRTPSSARVSRPRTLAARRIVLEPLEPRLALTVGTQLLSDINATGNQGWALSENSPPIAVDDVSFAQADLTPPGFFIINVSVHRAPTTPDRARVDFALRLTTPDGSPLTHLVPGQEFVLHVLTQDQSAPPRGVFAAYLDVAWDSELAAVTGPIHYASAYSNGKNGDTTAPGLIDEAGAFTGALDETGSAIYEVFSVPMRATASGSLLFTSNPADLAKVHDVLIYGMNDPVPTANVSYGAVSIDVGDALPLDVNADGQIAPSDVLLIVNAINTQIAAGIGDGSLPTALDSNRLDVNGDAHLTALDALIVINHINEPIVSSTAATQSTSSADAEGESSAALSDQALLALSADESYFDLLPSLRPRHRR